jgi:hypothetical protein
MFFTIHCTVDPDQSEALDDFLKTEAAPYWRRQEGVRSVTIRGAGQSAWPARSIVIEVRDVEALRRILKSDERQRLKQVLSGYVLHSNGSAWMRRSARPSQETA